MKKIIRQLLVVAILFSVSLSGYAFDFVVNGIYYNKNSDGKTVSVTFKDTNYNSYFGSVVIPSTVTSGTTYSVTSISSEAFLGCSGLTSVTIDNSVTSIGDGAFYECSGLTSVAIPNSVTEIGENAFYKCSGLTSVTIPNSVTSIGADAFYGTAWYDNQPDGLVYAGKVAYKYKGTMPNNTSITIEDGTPSIASSAFLGCSGLTSVTIPNSVTEIGKSAFSGTAWYNNQPDGLVYAGKVAYQYKGTMPDNTSITIEDGTTSITGGAFSNCTKLISVTIPNSVTSIGQSAFNKCSGLTSVTIPNTVTSIGVNVFNNCTNLTSVTIGNSVTKIGDYAFNNCNLTEVTSLAALPPMIMETTFSQSAYDNATLYVNTNSEDFYRVNEFWKNFNKIETLPGGTVIENVQLSVLFPDRGKVAIAVPYNKSVTLTVFPSDVAGFGLSTATFNSVEIIDELDENHQYTTPVLTEDAVLSVVYVSVASGVDQSLVNRIKVSASNGMVRVQGAAPESEVLVSNLLGKIVRRSTEKTFTLGEGIYVLNVEGLSFKFAM
ncbi:MAG: leucine-rich repeat protein [Candidatus Limisoma sp.]|nr:leucine-rich repeat protein [Candidatus Limisoma sp.]